MKERYKIMVASIFEVMTFEGLKYCIKMVSGSCLWFDTREARDEKFLSLQEW